MPLALLALAVLGVVGLARAPARAPRFEIHLRADGSISFAGRTFPLESVPQPDGTTRPQTPEGQDEALRALKAALAPVASRAREPDGSSRAVILIHGERDAKWKYTQWVMQVAADPTIRIYKMHFRVVPARDAPGR